MLFMFHRCLTMMPQNQMVKGFFFISNMKVCVNFPKAKHQALKNTIEMSAEEEIITLKVFQDQVQVAVHIVRVWLIVLRITGASSMHACSMQIKQHLLQTSQWSSLMSQSSKHGIQGMVGSGDGGTGGFAVKVEGVEGWHVGPLHWHHSAPDDQRLLQKREIQRRKKLQKPYARERPAIECSDILRSGIKIISGGEKGVNPEKEKSPLQGIMTVSSSQPSENIAPSLPELLQTTRIPKSVQEPSSEISVNQHSESPSHSGHDRGVSWVIQRRRETERGVAVGTPWQPHHFFQVSFAWSDRHNFGEHKLTQRNRLLVSSLFM